MTVSRSILLVPALALALVPSAAPAGEPLEPLDAWVGAQPIDPSRLPPSPAGLVATDRPQRLGAKILYVNFDGGQMTWCGGSNAPQQNCSTIFQGTVLPYSGDAVQRASVIQVIRKRLGDFGITVTDQRPQSGDYDMEMVGNWQGADPDFAGVAPNIDCFDAEGGETSFTLEASASADGIAEIVLQEIAHTWGLEHVDEQQDLLYPTTQGTNKTFQDTCHKIVSNTSLDETDGYCNSVHTQFCDYGWQNSYQELLYVFGESVPDTEPPAVSIVAPTDGATIDGGNVDLVISLLDDQTPAVITTDIVLQSDALPAPVEAGGAYASPGELTFPITDLPDGTYTVRVDVTDESDNPAADEVTFTVVGNPVEEPGDGSGDAGDADGSGSGGGSGEAGDAGDTNGSDDGADESGGGDAGADGEVIDPQQPVNNGGCDCRTDGSRPGLAFALLGALGLLLRRRRTPAPGSPAAMVAPHGSC